MVLAIQVLIICMGQGSSISGRFGKYALDQSEENRLGRGISGVVYKGRGPKVMDVRV